MNTIYRAWHHAREMALTPDELSSPLARRPYDLRQACLSTWLNAGVPPPQVAAWAGHNVAVLLNVYAKCLDGEQQTALPGPELSPVFPSDTRKPSIRAARRRTAKRAPDPGEPAGQEPFFVFGGRCRVRTCVGYAG
jgi:hypothetical protein